MTGAPRLEINPAVIEANARLLVCRLAGAGLGLMAVTKAVMGNPEVGQALVRAGIDLLADSRLENLARLRAAGLPARLALIRPPAPIQAEQTVALADLSFNTEPVAVAALAEAARSRGKVHRVVVLVELGDRRDGVPVESLPRVLDDMAGQKGIEVVGLAANLACLSGTVPDQDNMDRLNELAELAETGLGRPLELISGGSSANLSWLDRGGRPGKINNLRLGESILLGRDPLLRRPIPGLDQTAFRLTAPVIESYEKTGPPPGRTGYSTFGQAPPSDDAEPGRRLVLALGRQDAPPDGLTPLVDGRIVGATSDHLVMSAPGSPLRVGDEIAFRPDYAALLQAMTSPFVEKVFV